MEKHPVSVMRVSSSVDTNINHVMEEQDISWLLRLKVKVMPIVNIQKMMSVQVLQQDSIIISMK